MVFTRAFQSQNKMQALRSHSLVRSVSLHFYAIHFDSISFYNLLWKPNDGAADSDGEVHGKKGNEQ